MEGNTIKIAKYLSQRAGKEMRASYEMVAKEIGWHHPTGRGLGNNLYELLHYCKDNQLPPLTTILVKKGTRMPPDGAMQYIRAALGDIDVETAQEEVFGFNWSEVFEHFEEEPISEIAEKSGIWLTSFWGWSPRTWGCLNFTEEWMRDKFLERTEPGVLVGVYVSRSDQSDQNLIDQLVGFYEVTHEEGHLYDFIDQNSQDEHRSNSAVSHKWQYSLRANRAWEIRKPYPMVRDVLPDFITQATGRQIGARGLPISEPDHISNLLRLPVKQVPVFGASISDYNLQDQELFNIVKKVSRAVYPPKEPYFVAESNGPKHLYVMQMSSAASEWLLPTAKPPEGTKIYKVGFSKSPKSRLRQIQSAYPQGRFNWQIIYPNPIPKKAPFPDAETAIAGEYAMKGFLASNENRVLGGEFFLASEKEIYEAWELGISVAESSIKSS